MAFRFRADEDVRDAIRRCAREQLEHAARQLSEEIEKDPVGAVHSARKSIKKERALLRLAGGALARGERVRDNATLRDSARGLSGVRDRDVMVQTLDALSERFTGQLPASTFSSVREALAVPGPNGQSAHVDEAIEDLRVVQVRIEHWRLRREGWSAIDDGLLRTYRRGRKALRQARAEPSIENLHELRKRVKDLWYQLRLLAQVCGPAVAGQAKEAHRLSDLLGDDHDLAVLRETLVSGPDGLAVDLVALVSLIDHRREQLMRDARYVGERLYAEKPSAFGRRLRRCWKAGRSQARAVEDERPAELAEKTRSADIS
jgi:CHAD domain-containing protein